MLDRYKQLLKEYISFKSVSTDAKYQDGIQATVAWLKKQFEENGFQVTVVTGYDNPVVVAEYVVDPSYKTCLIYGHYDVQPADKEDGWMHEPFDVYEKDGRIYARGAIDNKGQNLVHIVAVTELIKQKKLKYNVKFMLEGNEETGSPSLEKLIMDNRELLKADFSMISDGELTGELPTLEVGFRGGFNLTLTVRTSSTDLHSGLFGGAAPNAAHELSKFIASLYTQEHVVDVPGFYDGVDEVTKEQREMNEQIPFTMDGYKNLSGTKALLAEPGYDFYTQTALRPTVQVTGMQSGYVGEGYRNSVPSVASAKINFRLVLHQDPEQVAKNFVAYAKQWFPEYVDVTVEYSDPYNGIKLSPDSEYVKRAFEKVKEAYGVTPIYKYCGGGLPIVTLYQEVLGLPNVLVPLANEDCRMHAPNENYNMENLEKALAFSVKFFSNEDK